MTARKLKVVGADHPAPPVVKEVTIKVAAAKSYRDLLVAQRDHIAGQIDGGVPPAYLAPLHRQLREVSKELEGIEAGDGGDDVGNAADTPDEAWPVS